MYFTLHASGTQTVAQKYQRLYDCLEDCGMPRDLRGKPLAEIAKWCAAETRTFNFEVVQHWQNPADKEFKPQGVGGSLPSITDLQAVANTPTLVVGDAILAAGNPATVIALEPNNMVKVKFASGQEMSILTANVVKAG